jgi:hypothetical protein
LNTLSFELLRLTSDGVHPGRLRTEQRFGNVALRACVEDEYCGAANQWKSFFSLDLTLPWTLAFHRLVGHCEFVHDFVPADVAASPLGISELVWTGVRGAPPELCVSDDASEYSAEKDGDCSDPGSDMDAGNSSVDSADCEEDGGVAPQFRDALNNLGWEDVLSESGDEDGAEHGDDQVLR